MPRFAFDFGSALTLPLRVTGIGPLVTSVRVDDDVLDVRFGLLRLRTPVANVADAVVTGPYNPLKALGVRVSPTDLGLTFGTSSRAGLCIRFVRPIAGVVPVPFLTHPTLTVTVAEPGRLQDALLEARDAALAEQEELVAEREPLAHPPAARPRATRRAQQAGTALEVVRPAETAVEPVRALVDAAGSTTERLVPTPSGADSSGADSSCTAESPGTAEAGGDAPRRATRAATKKAAPSSGPAGSQRGPRSGRIARRPETPVDQELAKRRLAGNLPADDGPPPSRP